MHSPNAGFTGQFETTPGSDDLFLKLPEEFLQSQDWRANDVLSLEATPGRVFVTNKTKAAREKGE